MNGASCRGEVLTDGDGDADSDREALGEVDGEALGEGVADDDGDGLAFGSIRMSNLNCWGYVWCWPNGTQSAVWKDTV